MNFFQKKWCVFLFLAVLCFNTLINAQTYMVPTSHGSLAVWDTGGSGKPVLFVHGNSLCKEVFQQQFQNAWTEEYRFIAIDLPGHGQSQRAQDPEKNL